MQQQTKSTSRRGRKSNICLPDSTQHIILKQHHFDYSDDFAELLYAFSKLHLEDNNKTFKTAWLLWKESNSDMIQTEIAKMKSAGYEGDVEEKMYFSARYYYRKKAMREQTIEPATAPRKKYECTDKQILGQMNDHIIAYICNAQITDDVIVRSVIPSEAYSDYCEKYGIIEEERTKKNYKNLYWRISKKMKVRNVTIPE
jgi:hypothetical protein